MKIRFLSKNIYKIKEVTSILNSDTIEIVPVQLGIDEIQTDNVEKLVRHKVLQAFKAIGKPVFVEHTGLYINYLRGFPAGLTQVFWDTLEADRFSQMMASFSDKSLIAKTIIGYCDGRNMHVFEGSITGTVPSAPRGNKDFQWDCVFIPDGHAQTFGEMTEVEKNKISMRRKALDEFNKFLKKS